MRDSKWVAELGLKPRCIKSAQATVTKYQAAWRAEINFLKVWMLEVQDEGATSGEFQFPGRSLFLTGTGQPSPWLFHRAFPQRMNVGRVNKGAVWFLF